MCGCLIVIVIQLQNCMANLEVKKTKALFNKQHTAAEIRFYEFKVCVLIIAFHFERGALRGLVWLERRQP